MLFVLHSDTGKHKKTTGFWLRNRKRKQIKAPYKSVTKLLRSNITVSLNKKIYTCKRKLNSSWTLRAIEKTGNLRFLYDTHPLHGQIKLTECNTLVLLNASSEIFVCVGVFWWHITNQWRGVSKNNNNNYNKTTTTNKQIINLFLSVLQCKRKIIPIKHSESANRFKSRNSSTIMTERENMTHRKHNYFQEEVSYVGLRY